MERGLDESAARRGAGQRGQCGRAAADAPAQRQDRPPPHRPHPLACRWGFRRRSCSPGVGRRGSVCGADVLLLALAAVLPALSTDLFGLPHAGVNYGFLALGQSVGSLFLFPCIADLWGFEQGRHILAIAGAAAGFACIWAVTPARREPQKTELEKLRSCAEKRK